MAKIIGIDPGSHRTGWGVIELGANDSLSCIEFGVIEQRESWPLALRLSHLHRELSAIIGRHQPREMSLEKVFMGKNADSAFKLGHARGVVMAVAGEFRLNVFEYATRSIKKMVAGHGGAEKEQVQFMIENILNLKVVSLDASDALALAIGHSRELEVQRKLKSVQGVFS